MPAPAPPRRRPARRRRRPAAAAFSADPPRRRRCPRRAPGWPGPAAPCAPRAPPAPPPGAPSARRRAAARRRAGAAARGWRCGAPTGTLAVPAGVRERGGQGGPRLISWFAHKSRRLRSRPSCGDMTGALRRHRQRFERPRERPSRTAAALALLSVPHHTTPQQAPTSATHVLLQQRRQRLPQSLQLLPRQAGRGLKKQLVQVDTHGVQNERWPRPLAPRRRRAHLRRRPPTRPHASQPQLS